MYIYITWFYYRSYSHFIENVLIFFLFFYLETSYIVQLFIIFSYIFFLQFVLNLQYTKFSFLNGNAYFILFFFNRFQRFPFLLIGLNRRIDFKIDCKGSVGSVTLLIKRCQHNDTYFVIRVIVVLIKLS